MEKQIFKVQIASNKTLNFPFWHDKETSIVVVEFDVLEKLKLDKKNYKDAENTIEDMIYFSLGYEVIERLGKLENKLAILAAS